MEKKKKKNSEDYYSYETPNNALKILELYKGRRRPQREEIESSHLTLFFKVEYAYEKQSEKNLEFAFSEVARKVSGCKRYENAKRISSITSTIKKAWLKHDAFEQWKEVKELFYAKMTDEEFV